MNNIEKKQNNFFYLLSIFFTTIFLLLIYSYKSQPDKVLKEPGFNKSSSLKNDNYLCKLGKENTYCFKKIINEFKQKNNNILFLGNSQMGAINNFSEEEKGFISILNDDSFLEKDEIQLKGIWFPNANIKEFEIVYNFINNCNIEIELLVIPVFLDDTRIEETRNDIKKLQNTSCILENRKFDENFEIKDNLNRLNNEIKKRIKFLSHLNSLNKSLRVDLYRIRNTVFNIKADSVRPLIKTSYKANINSLRRILEQRTNNTQNTVVYIPPLMHVKSNKKIPYKIEEYKKFKKEIKELCLKNYCEFKNLETIIPDENWGLKSKTNLFEDDKELDFMHFTYSGHQIMAEKFKSFLF